MQPLTWLSNTQRYPCQQIILEEVTMLLRVIRIPTSTSTKPISLCRKVQEEEQETMLLRAIKTPTSASTKQISNCRIAQENQGEARKQVLETIFGVQDLPGVLWTIY